MSNQSVGLTVNQRNIYQYFLVHQRRYKDTPCFVPKAPMQSSRVPDHIRALEALEEKKLIRVIRNHEHYTNWIIKPPEANKN